MSNARQDDDIQLGNKRDNLGSGSTRLANVSEEQMRGNTNVSVAKDLRFSKNRIHPTMLIEDGETSDFLIEGNINIYS